MTVFYGGSGSGKTSLLQAGGRPMLAAQQALLAVATPAAAGPLKCRLADGLAGAARRARLPGPRLRVCCQDVVGRVAAGTGRACRVGPGPVRAVPLVYGSDTRTRDADGLGPPVGGRGLFLRLVIVIRENFLGRSKPWSRNCLGRWTCAFAWTPWPGGGRGRHRRAGGPVRGALGAGHRGRPAGWPIRAFERRCAPAQLQITCDRLFQAEIALTPIPGDHPGAKVIDQGPVAEFRWPGRDPGRVCRRRSAQLPTTGAAVGPPGTGRPGRQQRRQAAPAVEAVAH